MIETGVVEAVFGDHEAVLLVVGMRLFLLYHDYHLFLFLFLFRRRLCQFQFLEVVHELEEISSMTFDPSVAVATLL